MRGLKQARVLGFDAGWAAMMRLLHKGTALICAVGMNDNGIEREVECVPREYIPVRGAGGLQLQPDRWGKNEKEMFGLLVGG